VATHREVWRDPRPSVCELFSAESESSRDTRVSLQKGPSGKGKPTGDYLSGRLYKRAMASLEIADVSAASTLSDADATQP